MATSESKKSVEDNVTERLMNALISKMENMDRDIQVVREENAMLRKAFDNPQSILRKAGFVPYTTPLSNDVMTDVFRGDMDVNSGNLMKQDEGNPDKYSNEQIHEMDWDEIQMY